MSEQTVSLVTSPAIDYKVFAEELTEVIWWMLGERDDLPPVPNDVQRRKYWWRHELRQRFEDAQIKAIGQGGDVR